ncbi:germinal-center associated nuclear protein-like [Brienomyrus brachyistius]|uniref:germinal-center associated nuclear protein-like n=1 Tax=Brienomyrus brachyistius TaxID=42636 RepID=UPI0020B3FE9F|nr:germinal-center associated nuclear protein-like [Brienomyrus brachyistius]
MWPHPRMARPRLQQKLFHSMVEDPESGSGVAPVLDAASSPQDLLARIEEEKEQSRRFEDQLRTWLDVESLGPSSSSSPLFLPSSLLSVPEIVVPSPKMAAPPALALQKERSVRSDQARGAASSMVRRLQELEQLISAITNHLASLELPGGADSLPLPRNVHHNKSLPLLPADEVLDVVAIYGGVHGAHWSPVL